jgi:hypothetical protein
LPLKMRVLQGHQYNLIASKILLALWADYYLFHGSMLLCQLARIVTYKDITCNYFINLYLYDIDQIELDADKH